MARIDAPVVRSRGRGIALSWQVGGVPCLRCAPV